MGFHLPAYAWLFALVAPLVLLYFLKLRRPSINVSSLVLWRRVLDDHRVNAPFQRFRRSLLLWLQLAGLCLLALAAMQPFFGGAGDSVARRPILIDCSASMAAREKDGGPTRLDLAKARAKALVDALGPGQEASVVAFASRARRVADFTSDRRRLFDAIDGITVEDEPSDVVDALRLAAALAQREPFRSVTLLSDGNVPPDADFALPFELDYELVGPGGANVGIVDLNAARGEGGGWEVFVRVVASADYRGAVLARLAVGDDVVADETIAMNPNETRDVVFRLQGSGDRLPLRVSLEPDAFDAMPSDDVAYLSLTPPRELRLWVAPALEWIAPYLAEQSRVVVIESPIPPVDADAIVSNRLSDERAGVRVALFVDAVPERAASLFIDGAIDLEIVDWERDDALLHHVDLRDVLVSGQRSVAPSRSVADFEVLGFQATIESSGGPLMLAERAPDRARWYLVFDPLRSTMPYRLAFPILLANLVRTAEREAGLLGAVGGRTGVLPPLRGVAGEPCTVTAPSGRTWRVVAGSDGLVTGIPATRVGRYDVAIGDERRSVGASLLDRRETSMVRVREIQFRESLRVVADGATRTERPLWPWLAALALVASLAEWWFYQRRPGGRQ